MSFVFVNFLRLPEFSVIFRVQWTLGSDLPLPLPGRVTAGRSHDPADTGTGAPGGV